MQLLQYNHQKRLLLILKALEDIYGKIRSSCLQLSLENDILKICRKFTGNFEISRVKRWRFYILKNEGGKFSLNVTNKHVIPD